MLFWSEKAYCLLFLAGTILFPLLKEKTSVLNCVTWFMLLFSIQHNYLLSFCHFSVKFLKFVEKTAPIAVYTSGKGSSAAGLTASVIRDNSSVSSRTCLILMQIMYPLWWRIMGRSFVVSLENVFVSLDANKSDLQMHFPLAWILLGRRSYGFGRWRCCLHWWIRQNESRGQVMYYVTSIKF